MHVKIEEPGALIGDRLTASSGPSRRANEWSRLLDHIVAGGGEPPPFVGHLELPYPARWEPGRVWLDWQVDPRLFHERDGLFGGFIAALADHALIFPTMSVLEDGETFTTSDLGLSFFRPVAAGSVQIEAYVVNRGRTMVHVEVVFFQGGRLVAKGAATQVVARPSANGSHN